MKKKIDFVWISIILLFFIAMFGITFWRGKTKIWRSAQDEEITILEAIDVVYTDAIVGKYSLAHIDSRLSYYTRSGKNVNATRTLIGKDQWMFLKDNLDSYLGKKMYSDDDIQKMIEHYMEIKTLFEEKGCEFVLFVAPNKMSVYDNYMPDYYVQRASEYDTTHLTNKLEETTEINVVFPLNEMLSKREEFQLFYKYDTHWNPLGAYVGVQTLLAELNEGNAPLSKEMIEEVAYIEHDSAKDDLAGMIGMSDYFIEKYDYSIKNCYQMENVENYGEGLYVNDAAPISKKVLFVGDSFRCDMVPYLVDNYSEVYHVHSENFDETLLETYTPDIVIYEVVEREFMNIGK